MDARAHAHVRFTCQHLFSNTTLCINAAFIASKHERSILWETFRLLTLGLHICKKRRKPSHNNNMNILFWRVFIQEA